MSGASGTRWGGTPWTSSPPPDWAGSGTASLTGVRVFLLNLSASLRWTFSGLIQICDSYSLEDREYFFDRSPRNFDAILGLYRNGKLHLAAGVSENNKVTLDWQNIVFTYIIFADFVGHHGSNQSLWVKSCAQLCNNRGSPDKSGSWSLEISWFVNWPGIERKCNKSSTKCSATEASQSIFQNKHR